MVSYRTDHLVPLLASALILVSWSAAEAADPKAPADKPAPTATSLPAKPDIVVRWTFLYEDVSEDMGGGYLSGEFLLLRDGRLFRRTVSSSSAGKTTTWRAGPWGLDPIWKPLNDVEKLVAHLTGRGFDLYPPSPVGVDSSSAGPFPGAPPPAGKPLHPARRNRH
jgi:hypothetical protein